MATGKRSGTPEPTPCEQGGDEILATGPVRCRVDDVLTFALVVCRSPAKVRVDMDGRPVTDTVVKDAMRITLPPMPAGPHTLFWYILFAGDDWQYRAELHINDVPVFRLRKSAKASKQPTNHGALFLQVVP